MAQIQWFPGHMAKAKREITDKIKLISMKEGEWKYYNYHLQKIKRKNAVR